MSSWHQYMKEKEQIDGLIESGCLITEIKEGLDGDLVRFERGADVQELLLLTADARKYIGSALIEQLRGAKA
jgi:hypothetical protein